MKKIIFTLLSFFALVISGYTQVGIGTTTPNASSVLDLTSTSKAFIPPRMSTTQRDQIANPVSGMMIYNSTTACIEFYKGTGWYNVCTGTISTPTLTSNDVAAANLIAHWTFDNTKVEAISGKTDSSTVGTVTLNATGGQIGGYASFTNGYLVYKTIPNINKPDALAAGFTFTTWAKIPTITNLTSLWQINGNIGDIWGTVAFTLRHAANDTLDFDGTLTHVNGSGTHSTYTDAFVEGGASSFKTTPTSWALIAMVYDTTGGSKKIKYYGNGVLIGTKIVSTAVIPSVEQFELIATSSFGGTGRNNVTFGTFNYSPTPFASGGGGSAGWQNTSLPAGTAIDDTRLYNKALSASEINDLWVRGSAGN